MFPAFNYLLLDAARMGDMIDDAILRNGHCESLYKGLSEASLASVAPYLFSAINRPQFSDWRLAVGWSHSWGVLLQAAVPLVELHRHFRKFLLLKTEGGKELYFRFYDPRVLRVFLPTCNEDQICEFFGPVQYFIAEDEDPDFALRFSHERGVLRTERICVRAYLDQLPAAFPVETDSLAAADAPPKPESGAATTATLDAHEQRAAPPTVTTHHFVPKPEPVAASRRSKWMMFD